MTTITPLPLSAASDLLSIERLVVDAVELLARARYVASRLAGRLSDDAVARVRANLLAAANAAREATAPLAGALAEAADVMRPGEPPF